MKVRIGSLVVVGAIISIGRSTNWFLQASVGEVVILNIQQQYHLSVTTNQVLFHRFSPNQMTLDNESSTFGPGSAMQMLTDLPPKNQALSPLFAIDENMRCFVQHSLLLFIALSICTPFLEL
jgi:hypothetical protein